MIIVDRQVRLRVPFRFCSVVHDPLVRQRHPGFDGPEQLTRSVVDDLALHVVLPGTRCCVPIRSRQVGITCQRPVPPDVDVSDELVYRYQLRPVLQNRATVVDDLFGAKKKA